MASSNNTNDYVVLRNYFNSIVIICFAGNYMISSN